MNRQKSDKLTLIFCTVVILILNLTVLLQLLTSTYDGHLASSLCYAAGDICIIVAWVQYFRKYSKK